MPALECLQHDAWTRQTAHRWCALRLALALILALAFATLRAAAGEAPARKPNIVVLVADDLGYRDTGFQGGEIATPNLDALAQAGAILDRFYVAPLCTPTRACFLTGRYPMRQGLQTLVIFPWAQYGLPLEERTLPQALQEAGYTTAIVGKWHLGHARKAYLPRQRGFDSQYGLYNGAIGYFNRRCQGVLDWHRDEASLDETGYSTELLGNEAVRVLERHDFAKPLFLYVPFNAPHAPSQVPPGFKEPYANLPEPRRTYAGMVACMDLQVGRIAAKLREREAAGNTIVLFFSDNGGLARDGASNGNLRGGKGMLYEGGVRVPAFAVWPARLPAGRIVKEPLHVSDWYPTLLNLAGAPLAQQLPIDGVDIWPVLAEGAPRASREILLNVTPRSGALRIGDWKIVRNGSAVVEDLKRLGTKEQRAQARGRKSAQTGDPAAAEAEPERESEAADDEIPRDVYELFNLADDPRERRDRAADEPAKWAELKARLEALAAQAAAPLSQPEPPGFIPPPNWEPAE
ncbi:MAG: hypothetical protein AMXMBFR7_10180 [Planctomycetota bacterium]